MRVPTPSGRRSGKGGGGTSLRDQVRRRRAVPQVQTRLQPQSETVFVNGGLAIEFVMDSEGVPTHLWDKHVSGDYRFDRTR